MNFVAEKIKSFSGKSDRIYFKKLFFSENNTIIFFNIIIAVSGLLVFQIFEEYTFITQLFIYLFIIVFCNIIFFRKGVKTRLLIKETSFVFQKLNIRKTNFNKLCFLQDDFVEFIILLNGNQPSKKIEIGETSINKFFTLCDILIIEDLPTGGGRKKDFLLFVQKYFIRDGIDSSYDSLKASYSKWKSLDETANQNLRSEILSNLYFLNSK